MKWERNLAKANKEKDRDCLIRLYLRENEGKETRKRIVTTTYYDSVRTFPLKMNMARGNSDMDSSNEMANGAGSDNLSCMGRRRPLALILSSSSGFSWRWRRMEEGHIHACGSPPLRDTIPTPLRIPLLFVRIFTTRLFLPAGSLDFC